MRRDLVATHSYESYKCVSGLPVHEAVLRVNITVNHGFNHTLLLHARPRHTPTHCYGAPPSHIDIKTGYTLVRPNLRILHAPWPQPRGTGGWIALTGLSNPSDMLRIPYACRTTD